MLPPIATGQSSFVRIRSQGALYVDKTAFVAEVLRDPAPVLLFCRPRRFGKTLNMTTLRAFVERSNEDTRPLFAGLAIERAGPDVWQHFRRSPVIWLSLKDAKASTWDETAASIGVEVAVASQAFQSILESTLTADQAATYARIRDRSALHPEHVTALRDLCAWLHLATGEPAVILIDEYDTPILAAQEHGYLPEALSFFRRFFGAGLKDNDHLGRAVLTGILRVAKESLFSDLNNVSVNTVLSHDYDDAFGFTEQEVSELALQGGLTATIKDAIRAYYDGYRFGLADIYNPWSVTQFLRHKDRPPAAYWINTSENSVVRELLVERGTIDSPSIEALLRGETIETHIDEHVVLPRVTEASSALFAYLVMAGYLRAEAGETDDEGMAARLRVPNSEVRQALRRLVREPMHDGRLGPPPGALAEALLAGDGARFEAYLQAAVARVLSYHDLGGPHPERVYQAFVAGLLVVLDKTHSVETNREAGFGRADVLVIPRRPGLAGVVMELKVGGHESLADALEQIHDRNYAITLRNAGAAPIRLLAATFDGKRVKVRFKTQD